MMRDWGGYVMDIPYICKRASGLPSGLEVSHLLRNASCIRDALKDPQFLSRDRGPARPAETETIGIGQDRVILEPLGNPRIPS